MTRDEIIKMAKEAGIEWQENTGITGRVRITAQGSQSVEKLERFATLVAATEREACAKVAAAISDKYAFGYYGNETDTADEIAKAIRAKIDQVKEEK